MTASTLLSEIHFCLDCGKTFTVKKKREPPSPEHENAPPH
jgi:hypothetical protein